MGGGEQKGRTLLTLRRIRPLLLDDKVDGVFEAAGATAASLIEEPLDGLIDAVAHEVGKVLVGDGVGYTRCVRHGLLLVLGRLAPVGQWAGRPDKSGVPACF